ncbi:MAG: hypothetical protein J3Q66DRAFT_98852 [Benniella sp.]|nr:MAG: hypothetical protein J3Q66DRAFT_98852 [Benniella sp.]
MVWHLLMLFISLANGLCSCEQDRRGGHENRACLEQPQRREMTKGQPQPGSERERERERERGVHSYTDSRLLYDPIPFFPRGTVISGHLLGSVFPLSLLPSFPPHLFFILF